MNHDTPPSPREELEARLTALLLGELPDAEAAALRELIRHDAALAALHDRLSRTIALVRETAATAEQPSAAPPAPLKLSDHRRQTLLQHFKTVAPKEFQRPRRRWAPWLQVAAAAAIVGVLGALLLPNLHNFQVESSIRRDVGSEVTISDASDAKFAAEIARNQALQRGQTNQSKQMAFFRLKPNGPPQGSVWATKPAPTVRSAPVAPEAAAPTKPVDHAIFLPTVEKSGEVAQTPLTAPSLAPPSQQLAFSGSPNNRFIGRNAYIVTAAPKEPGVAGAVAKAQLSQPKDALVRGKLDEAKAAQDRGDNASFNKLIAEANGAAIRAQGGTVPSSISGQTTAGLPLVDPATGLPLPPGSPVASATAEPIDPATGLPVPAALVAGQWATAEPASAPITYAQPSDISQALESLKAAPQLAANGVSFDVPPGNQPLTQPQLVYGSGGGSGGGGGGGGGAATFAKRGTQSQPARMYRQESPTPAADKSTDDLRMKFAGTPKELARNEPPQVSIKAKFVDAAPTAQPSLGYDWNLANSPKNNVDVEATSITNSGTIFLPLAQAAGDRIDSFSLGLSGQNRVQGVTNYSVFEFDSEPGDSGGVGKTPLLADVPLLGALFGPKDSADASKNRAADQVGRQAGEQFNSFGYEIVQSTNFVAGVGAVDNENIAATANPGLVNPEWSPAKMHQGSGNAMLADGSVQQLSSSRLRELLAKNQDGALNSTFALANESATNAFISGVTRSPIVLPPVPPGTTTELAYYTAAPRAALPPGEASQTGSLAAEPDKKRNAAAESDSLSAASAIREAEFRTTPSAVLEEAPATAPTAAATSDPKNQPYWEAKRDLEELLAFRKILDMKIAQEKIDYSLPKTTMVKIVDKAEPPPAHSQNSWDALRRTFSGKVEPTARLKVERDQSDISGFAERTPAAYDPYFIQTEFEALQSDAVLGKVVKDLDLNAKWGKSKGAGQPLDTKESIKLLKKSLDLRPVRNTSLIEVGVKSDNGQEAAQLANAVAEAYLAQRLEKRKELTLGGITSLEERVKEENEKVELAQAKVDKLRRELKIADSSPSAAAPSTSADAAGESEPVAKSKPKAAPSTPADEPQPEVQSRDQAFSTFSLNVSDVSFKLAAASLEKGVLPEPASVRSEEFINAFDYRDPEPPPGVPVAFAWERARDPFAQNRDLLRFSLKTAAQGREPGRPLNLVLLLDTSGSMERADRVRIIHEALRVLADQLQPQDKFSVVTFARTARLWVDGVPGNEAARIVEEVGGLTPQGGTNLEEAMKLAYQTALRHYLAAGINRVVLLTDGAANLGNVDPAALKQRVEAHRKQGIALDCFGVGWEGYNDDLLEVLTRNGDGRYGFINTPEEAADGFAGQLAGALHVAAADVKVQVEFNPRRVTAYRQLGYAKHQLTKEQFRDNTVAAAQIGAAESGNALYVIAVNPRGEGPLCTVRVRYKVPATGEIHEHEWTAPYNGNAVPLEEASPAMRLSATASAFSEWLASSPYAADVTPDRLLGYLRGVPEVCGADARPKKLEWMLRQAKSIAGK